LTNIPLNTWTYSPRPTAVNQWQICSLSRSISAFDVSFSTGTFYLGTKIKEPGTSSYFSIFYITYHSEDKGRQFGLKIVQKKRNRGTNNRILYTI
jgi:hypothetical protein